MVIRAVNVQCGTFSLHFSSQIWGELNRALSRLPGVDRCFFLLSIKKWWWQMGYLICQGVVEQFCLWAFACFSCCMFCVEKECKWLRGTELPADWGLLLLENTSSSPHWFLFPFGVFTLHKITAVEQSKRGNSSLTLTSKILGIQSMVQEMCLWKAEIISAGWRDKTP